MITAQDLMQAGAHIGHKKSKWNPKMAPFVFGVRNSLHIIDVTKTVESLMKLLSFNRNHKSGGTILFVGARIQTKEMITEMAKNLVCLMFVVGGLEVYLQTLKLLKKD